MKKTHELYVVWRKMRERCLSKNCKDFKNYGGRGITICKEWDSFEQFVKDMGERPVGHTLDRINNDGNYESSNCRWTDRRTQNINRRNIKEAKGISKVGNKFRARYMINNKSFSKYFNNYDEAYEWFQSNRGK